MDNLRKAIHILFEYGKSENVIQNTLNIKKECIVDNIDDKLFCSTFSFKYPQYYSNDEIENLIVLMKSKWLDLKGTSNKNIFNILPYFTCTRNVLTEENNVPIIEYNNLLRWREISYYIGEDILTTSYFAYKEIIINKKRTVFAWNPLISNNNRRIQKILSKGVSENHFHLKGSSPHLNISWLSLMNDLENREKEFAKLEKESKQKPEINFEHDTVDRPFHYLIKKAAAIRILFFVVCSDIEGKNKEHYISTIRKLLKGKTDYEVNLYVSELQKLINVFKYDNGKRFGSYVPDYAIPKNYSQMNYLHNNTKYNGFILFYGERKLMYDVFIRKFSGDKEINKYIDLFYAYLLIKTKLRKEIIQTNNRVGFSNFRIYQTRKDYFIKPNSFYEKAIYNLAIHTSLINDKSINESRFAPRKSVKKYNDYVNKLDSAIESDMFYDDKDLSRDLRLLQLQKKEPKSLYEKYLIKELIKNKEGRSFTKENKKRYFYGVHFIKLADKKYNLDDYKNLLIPKNHNVRKKVEIQAKALVNFKMTMSEKANEVVMIDAANSEIGCRPEVFAHAFRYIKYYENINEYTFADKTKNILMGYSYHVGEDFIDIVDGLRAIEEAIYFLNLKRSDRLGHALALGIEPHEYYDSKNHLIMISKQDLVDNIAWLLNKCRKYNINLRGISDKLIGEFERNYIYIYGVNNNYNNYVTHHMYYDAWKLRGDSPYTYLEFNYKKGGKWTPHALTFWQVSALNDFENKLNEELKVIRQNPKYCDLYFRYHFDPQVKTRGSEITQFKVYREYIDIVRELQENLQREILKRQIGIETNPSSNYVIGTFKRYAKHPIVRYYNLGLTYDNEKIQKCPQLSVSINTDDQGVFATNLENEYALMALALEKARDDKGNLIYNQSMIYDWLERIREMGYDQSFHDIYEKISNNNNIETD